MNDNPFGKVDPFNQGGLDAFKSAHMKADTDAESSSLHHTLGKGPLQAAPGNHFHGKLPDTDWIDLPLINGWQKYDGDSQWRSGYRRLSGITYLRGLIKKPVGPVTDVMFVLPVGFRCASNNIFPAIHAGNTSTWLYVEASGAVYAPSGTANAAWIAIPFSWPADQ